MAKLYANRNSEAEPLGPSDSFQPKHAVYVYLALFIASAFLFWPSLLGQKIWDDVLIMDGSGIGGGTFKGALNKPFLSYFRPLTSLSYLLDRTLYNTDIFGYHLTSILLHSAAACLIAWIGILLTRKWPVGLVAGLAFIVQPSQVGVAAWVGGRTDALSCVLICLYLGWVIQYCQRSRPIYLILAIIALLLASFTKEQNVSLLLALPLALVWVGKRTWKEALRPTVPALIAALAYFTIWVKMRPPGHGLTMPTIGEYFSRIVLSATNYFFVFTGWATKPLFTLSLENYRNSLGYAIGLIVVAVSIAGLVIATRKGGTVAFLAWLLALSYFPVSNLIPVPALLVAPYRIGVASVFFALILGYLLNKNNRTAYGVVAMLMVTTAYQTIRTIPMWSLSFDFSRTVHESDPYSFLGAKTYAYELLGKDKRSESLEVSEGILDWLFDGKDWMDAKKIQTESEDGQPAVVKLKRNAGTDQRPGDLLAILLFVRANSIKDQAEAYRTLKLAELMNPRDPEVLASIGDHLIKDHRAEGVRYYERSVKQDPSNWQNLWRLARQRGIDRNYYESEQLFLNALERAPLASSVWFDYAKMLEQAGHYQAALDAIANSEKGYVLDSKALDKAKARIKKKLDAENEATSPAEPSAPQR